MAQIDPPQWAAVVRMHRIAVFNHHHRRGALRLSPVSVAAEPGFSLRVHRVEALDERQTLRFFAGAARISCETGRKIIQTAA